jgi:hypothetical protein
MRVNSPERNAARPRLRYHYVLRPLVRLALVALVLAPAIAAAATNAPAVPVPAFEPADKAHDGGVLAGKIVGIDYVRGIMNLRDGRRTHDVYVLPSTNIQGKQNAYYTIADLKRGENVEVFTSVNGTRTNAQIIKLK